MRHAIGPQDMVDPWDATMSGRMKFDISFFQKSTKSMDPGGQLGADFTICHVGINLPLIKFMGATASIFNLIEFR